MITGATAITDAAMIDPHGICPWTPSKRAIPTGMVRAELSVVSIRAKRNSLNENINDKMKAEKRPGFAVGYIILNKI